LNLAQPIEEHSLGGADSGLALVEVRRDAAAQGLLVVLVFAADRLQLGTFSVTLPAESRREIASLDVKRSSQRGYHEPGGVLVQQLQSLG